MDSVLCEGEGSTQWHESMICISRQKKSGSVTNGVQLAAFCIEFFHEGKFGNPIGKVPKLDVAGNIDSAVFRRRGEKYPHNTCN